MKIAMYTLLASALSFTARATDPPECAEAHTGIFEMASSHNVTTVKRTGTEQTDYIGEHFMRYKIKWTDDCTCELRLLDTDIDSVKPLVGATYTVVITSVKGDRFRISTTYPDETVTTGEMRKYKNQSRAH